MLPPEQQLRVYRLLVENSLGLMCVHDLDGVLLAINPAAAKSLGYRAEDGVGRNIREFLDPSVQALFSSYLQRIRANPVDNGMMKLRARDGSERIWLYRNVRYEEPGAAVCVLGHALDITEHVAAEQALKRSQLELTRTRDELELRVIERTAELMQAKNRLEAEMAERKKVEDELLRVCKLEAIGGLAGGIAHDYNNLMTVIVGYCESLRGALPKNPQLYEQVNQIYKAAEQANSLTRRLLAFSRRQRLEPTLLNLNDVLTETAEILRRAVREDIEVTILTESALGLIRADRGQIEQVLMNLIINASDAMPRGGKLLLKTGNTTITKDSDQSPAGALPGRYIRLTVSDTGVGMDKDIQARIFEPFFTTKEVGKGTGLGLATVYGIIGQAAGHIVLESEPGQGTTFEVYFPQAEGKATVTKPSQPPAFDRPTCGTETILVVDDQKELRTLICELLRNGGYKVLSAANGREALRVVGDYPEAIDLIVADMVMPEMGGRELAETLGDAPTPIKVLYMSGYTGRDEDLNAVLSLGHAFIEKPFTPQALLQRIREILDGGLHRTRFEGEGKLRRLG